MRLGLPLVVLLCACGADRVPSTADLGADATSKLDDDQDGLDDGEELELARRYLPFLAVSPTDACPTGGLLVRVRPHPADPTLIHALYVHLYDQDCGLGGHAGDDEVFAVTLDPAVPPPEGITSMIAISHQGTLCQRISRCGRCGGLPACQTLPRSGQPWPAVWASRDKHGGYVNASTTCAGGATCFDACDDAPMPASRPIVNAGEPAHPLVHDLTDQGFITAANGWKNSALFHFDPWKAGDFGGAGSVFSDLTDSGFDGVACRP